MFNCLAIFINLCQRGLKWTFILSSHSNYPLFNRDGLFQHLAIFINEIA